MNKGASTMLKEDELGLSPADENKISSLTVPVPDNEFDRIKILRQANLLDTNKEDGIYDRFTSLAKRIFNVPITAISLVDVERQWFKSSIGLDADETHRNHAFCSYTVLPENPEVFVVADATKDPRFCNNPLVTSSPHIRFYAGAALVVGGVRVGSLCLIDTVPHTNFSMNDRMNLLDMGEAVSQLIRDRRDATLNLDKERMRVMLETIQHVRAPMEALRTSHGLLKANEEMITEALAASDKSALFAPTFGSCLNNISSSLVNLNVYVEQCVTLGESLITVAGVVSQDADGLNDVDEMPTLAVKRNVIASLAQARTVLRALDIGSDRARWHVDDSELKLGTHFSHPSVIKFILLNVTEKALHVFQRIDTRFTFVHRNSGTSCAACDMDGEDMDGFLSIEMTFNGLVGGGSFVDSATLSILLKLDVVDRLLRDVGGNRRLASFSADDLTTGAGSESCLVEFRVPLVISAGPENYRAENVALIAEAEGRTGSAKASTRSATSGVRTSFKSLAAEVNAPSTTSQNPQTSLAAQGAPAESPKTPAPAPAPAPSPAVAPPAPVRDKPLDILLVDDSQPIQKMMRRWLEAKGCVVTSALNGKMGLVALKKQTFDLTLMDFLMPVQLGLETMKLHEIWRKESPNNNHNKDMLMIGISATAGVEEQDEGFNHGMHFFSSKPIDLTILLATLDALRTNESLDQRVAAISALAGLVGPAGDAEAVQVQVGEHVAGATGPTENGPKTPSISYLNMKFGVFRNLHRRSNKVAPI